MNKKLKQCIKDHKAIKFHDTLFYCITGEECEHRHSIPTTDNITVNYCDLSPDYVHDKSKSITCFWRERELPLCKDKKCDGTFKTEKHAEVFCRFFLDKLPKEVNIK